MLKARFPSSVLLLASACLAQTQNPGALPHPNNNFPDDPAGYNFFPGDHAVLKFCTVVPGTDPAVPVNGVPWSVFFHNTAQSGGHTHEQMSAEGFGGPSPSNSGRPKAQFLTPTFGITGSDANGAPSGCNYIGYQLPDYAGWVTFEVQNPAYTVGVNNYLTFYEFLSTRHSGGAAQVLVPLPDDQTIMQPQSVSIDTSHSGGGYTHYVNPKSLSGFLGLARSYQAAVQIALPGFTDRVNPRRCAGPDGGDLDNDWTGLAPYNGPVQFFWETRFFEGHGTGEECDYANPGVNFTGDTRDKVQKAFNDALTLNACRLGLYSPDGDVFLGPLAQVQFYWGTSDAEHVICGPRPSASKRPVPIR